MLAKNPENGVAAVFGIFLYSFLFRMLIYSFSSTNISDSSGLQ